MSPVKSPEETRAREVRNKDKIVDAKGEAEEVLPAGWKMEVKVRPGSAKKKVDRTYTDPVTGYIFHSLKDVQRYLKTGEVGRLATKPKDNKYVEDKTSEMATREQSSNLGENKKVENSVESNSTKDACGFLSERFSRHKRPLEDGYITRSSERRKSESPQPQPERASKRVALPAEPKTRHATKLAGIKIEASPPTLPQPKARQAACLSAIKIDTAPPSSPEPKTHQLSGVKMEPKTRQATQKAGIEVDATAPLPPERKTRQPEIKVDVSSPEPKTRLATQKAGIEVDASAPLPLERKTRQPEIKVDVSSPQPKTRQAKRKAGIEVDTSPPLPPECKTRHAEIKVDASFPEPKTHQQAGIEADASAPERKTRQVEIKLDDSISSPPPQPKTCDAEIEVDASSPEPKTRQQAGIKLSAEPKTNLSAEPKTRQAKRLSGTKVDALSPEPKTRQARRLSGMEIDPPKTTPPPPEPKTRQATQPTQIEIDASPALVPDTQPTEMEVGTSHPQPKTRKATRSAIKPSPPVRKTRQATRQAGIKTDDPLPSLPDSRTTHQASARRVRVAETSNIANLDTPPIQDNNKPELEKTTSCEMQVEITNNRNQNADKCDDKKETPITLPPVSQEGREKKHQLKIEEKQKWKMPSPPPKQHYNDIEMGPPPGFPPITKHQPPPTIMNFGIHDKQKLPIVNPPPPPPPANPIPQNPEPSINFSLNDFWTDPCIEFAVKTLTGAIPFNDLNKPVNNFPPSPLEVPMEDLWTDPCIEFAVKTLTGAIPVAQDSYVKDYSQHQPATTTSDSRGSQNFSLPDMGMNFCQTDIFSNPFQTSHNKQQQGSVVGNGGLQQAANIVFPQGGSSSNGQCSRPRFFQ